MFANSNNWNWHRSTFIYSRSWIARDPSYGSMIMKIFNINYCNIYSAIKFIWIFFPFVPKCESYWIGLFCLYANKTCIRKISWIMQTMYKWRLLLPISIMLLTNRRTRKIFSFFPSNKLVSFIRLIIKTNFHRLYSHI